MFHLPTTTTTTRGLRMLLTVAAAVPASGCVAATIIPLTAGLGAGVAITHHTPDSIYAALHGRDCSLVRLDQGLSYCRQPDPPPTPQPYCTRSLGIVDCWAHPEAMTDLPPQVAQGGPGQQPPGFGSTSEDRRF